jgi:hypothetical protein
MQLSASVSISGPSRSASFELMRGTGRYCFVVTYSNGHFARACPLYPPKVRASAKQVADIICGYPEIICGAMIARQIFDKLLALPTAITCDTDPADNPAENSTTKRRRLACSEFCGRLSLRIARHVNSQVDPERSFFAWPSCRQPITSRRCTVTRIAPLRRRTTS